MEVPISVRIVSFSDEFVSPAANLLAQRHERDRLVSPELPARFERAEAATAAVRAALAREHAAGFAAVDNGGRLLAYLIGDMVFDVVWGRSGWVRWAGCGYHPEFGAEPVRDLYAALGARWVEYGIFTHCALMPVSDPALIGAWFSLSFGVEQVYALQDLARLGQRQPPPPGLTLLKAGSGDEQHLADLSDVIWPLQVKAPTWAAMMPETIAGRPEAWAEMATEKDANVWLILRGDEPLAVQVFWPAKPEADNLTVADGYAHMGPAGTREEARGRGLSTFLSEHVLHAARAAGYRYMDTDWRSANLMASRFWPRRGYRPVFYRLVRRLDARIAWADGVD